MISEGCSPVIVLDRGMRLFLARPAQNLILPGVVGATGKTGITGIIGVIGATGVTGNTDA